MAVYVLRLREADGRLPLGDRWPFAVRGPMAVCRQGIDGRMPLGGCEIMANWYTILYAFRGKIHFSVHGDYAKVAISGKMSD